MTAPGFYGKISHVDVTDGILSQRSLYISDFVISDTDDFSEEFVPVPEQGGGKLIPEGLHKPGQVYTVSRGKSGMFGVFKLETEMVNGSGKFERTGIGSDREAKESLDTAYRYLKGNGKNISGTISTSNKDYFSEYTRKDPK